MRFVEYAFAYKRKIVKIFLFLFCRNAGLLAHTFTKTGVYEITDLEHPEFKCVILCRPSPKQHVVRIKEDEFSPGSYICMESGRILLLM